MPHHEGESAKGETGDCSVEHENLPVGNEDDREVFEDPGKALISWKAQAAQCQNTRIDGNGKELLGPDMSLI